VWCTSAPLAYAPPLRPSGFPLRPLRYSPHHRPRELSLAVHPPKSFGPPPEYDGTSPPSARLRLDSSSHEVSSPLRAISATGPLVAPGANPSPPSALRFSQPLGGFLPASPRGLISSRSARPGFSLQGFLLPEEPHRLSATLALLPLPSSTLPCGRVERRLVYRALLPSGSPLHTGKQLSRRRPVALLRFHLSRAPLFRP